MAFMPATKIVSLSTFLDACKNTVADLLPFIQNLNIGFEDSSVHSVLNAVFWCSIIFGAIYYYFQKIVVVSKYIHIVNIIKLLLL